MTVLDLFSMKIDKDITTDAIDEAFMFVSFNDYELTPYSLDRYKKVLELTVLEINDSFIVVNINDSFDDELYDDFMYLVKCFAGYCSVSTFDKLFKEKTVSHSLT